MRSPKILAFCGEENSGRTLARKQLKGEYANIAFREPVHRMVEALLLYRGFDITEIDYCIRGKWKDVCLDVWRGKSTRYVITMLTNCLREKLHEDFLLDCFDWLAEGHERIANDDIQFENEARHIHSRGGRIARITHQKEPKEQKTDNLTDIIKSDFKINNDGSLEFLALQVSDFQEMS